MDWLGTRMRWMAALLLMAAWLHAPAGARADQLVADLSQHLIAITTAFVGTEVVLFGTAEGEVVDIVVTVHGPRHDQIVRRKARVGGIWINRDSLAFDQVPSYYAVGSTRPLGQIVRPDVMARLELGIDHLRLRPIDATGLDISEIATFQDALIRNKQRQGLYSSAPEPVHFIGPQLFRTTLDFPANVPPGIYQVQVFEVREGQVTDAQRSTLVISKIGLEADVFDFAHQQAALYGLLAILVAITAGWLAGVIFRRG
jgi:uncharacterized protein (TIGR02186 family)